uniref:P-type H(+)-exporting transporter n=1 Tax=Chlamydomonas leiostraca TaxID=1034604 RepID=A0A7S0S4X3_9CHLO
MLLSLLPLFAPPRHDTKDTIEKCHMQGIEVKMITGDHLLIGKETAKLLGMGAEMYPSAVLIKAKNGDKESMHGYKTLAEMCEKCNGFAEVFPEHKYEIVKILQDADHVVGMTGDGVNDAPALKKADVGIAVHGATDAARGAADIVLTEAGLSTIVTAVIGARKIFKRMTTYANYTVAMTFRICFTFGLLTVIYDWYFPTILIVIMAVFNDGAMIALSKDRVVPDKTPNSWNLKNIFIMGMVYGLYLTLSTWALYQTAVKTTFFEDKCDLFSLNDRHVELRAWCGAKLEREYLGAPGSGMPFDSAAQFDAAGSVCQIPGYGAQHHICPQGPVAPGGVLDGDQPSALHQCMIEQKYIRGAMTRSLLYTQVSISGQALVFVVRTRDWSLANRAGTATYIAFLLAQIGSSLIGVFGFGGYVEPRHRVDDCEFCGLSTGGRTPFFDSKVVPIAGTESDYTASVIGCTGYVIVAWIWSAIWYVLLDPIKWAMYWILNEDGFRDQVAFRHEKKRTLERSSKEQTGEVFNGPAGFAPANYANPLGRASMSKPVSAVLDRKSAALVPINRTSMTISNDPNRAMNIARRSFVGQGMQRRTSFERKSHEIHAASPKAADAPKH